MQWFFIINKAYSKHYDFLKNIVVNFDSLGTDMGNYWRNSLKLFKLDNQTLNVKSFKVPNIFNQIAYKFLRKSKAQRSYLNAHKLLSLDIKTPEPIAFFEEKRPFLFKKSFYISNYENYDFTYREVIYDKNLNNREQIIREFTRFTHKLHESNILFLDHSPGNTLIKYTNGIYSFYLVDLNRMSFKKLTSKERFKNFERMLASNDMIDIISDEYSKLSNYTKEHVAEQIIKHTEKFKQNIIQKEKLKSLIPWRKS